MDVASTSCVRHSMAKDAAFEHADIKQAPWYAAPSDYKKAARLTCINHLLTRFDYQDAAPDVIGLPEMQPVTHPTTAQARADVRSSDSSD